MKKLIAHILIVTIFTLGIGGALAVPQTAHAACNLAGAVIGNGLTDCVNELVVVAVMPIVGKFLQLSAYLFDHAITLNLNIAQFLQTCTDATCKTSPVEVVWKLIRDISGMFFIFVLVWASILMILRGESSKNTIIGVIMAGLLVNFSLFATKVIIDGSNSLTLTVYSAISPNYNPTLAASVGFGAQDVNRQIPGSVSSKIMQVVDIQSLYASTKDATKKTNFNVSSIVSTVGGISLMLVLGIAFLAAGLMFLWRFVMLLGLMALSPIPALAYAFPGLRGQSDKFIKKLLDQCFFAPVFLFFLYIALKVMTDPAFLALSNPNHSTFAGVFGGGGIAPLIQYGLVIFIIFTGLVTAKSFGVKGADFGINGINWLSKMGQGALKNTAGFAGQHTVGRAAKELAGSETFKNFAEKNPNLAVFASSGLKKTSSSTFGGTKGGYDDRLKKYSKERSDLAKKLTMPKEYVDARVKEQQTEKAKENEAIDREINRKQDYAKRLKITIDSDPTGKTAEGRNAKKELEKTVEEISAYETTKKENSDYIKNKEGLEKKYKNERVEKFKENLKNGWNPVTRAGDKDAAEAIEKELKKGKKDKILKEFSDIVNEESKSDDKPTKDDSDKKEKA